MELPTENKVPAPPQGYVHDTRPQPQGVRFGNTVSWSPSVENYSISLGRLLQDRRIGFLHVGRFDIFLRFGTLTRNKSDSMTIMSDTCVTQVSDGHQRQWVKNGRRYCEIHVYLLKESRLL